MHLMACRAVRQLSGHDGGIGHQEPNQTTSNADSYPPVPLLLLHYAHIDQMLGKNRTGSSLNSPAWDGDSDTGRAMHVLFLLKLGQIGSESERITDGVKWKAKMRLGSPR